ncbi:hypothetical protein QBE52_09830 [Clostridiaceae bacterium 35-E11]
MAHISPTVVFKKYGELSKGVYYNDNGKNTFNPKLYKIFKEVIAVERKVKYEIDKDPVLKTSDVELLPTPKSLVPKTTVRD